MGRELKVPFEEIKKEMEEIVIPHAKDAGLTINQSLQIAIRYAAEREKDYEWESNERAMTVAQDLIDKLSEPINVFQRKYGLICLN